MNENKDFENAWSCEHCTWCGKNILQHMRYNNNCMKKTDMTVLRQKVKEKNQHKKRKYQKMYDEDHREQKKEYYADNIEQKKEYQKI